MDSSIYSSIYNYVAVASSLHVQRNDEYLPPLNKAPKID